MKRASRPMQRKDWAWVMACVICGIGVACSFFVVQADAGKAHYGTQYTFTTTDDGKTTQSVEQVVSSTYASRVTILSNGHVQEIMSAVSGLGLKDISVRPSSNLPASMDWSDYFIALFAYICGFMLFTYLFRIIEKICGKILGVKPPADDIENPPSQTTP